MNPDACNMTEVLSTQRVKKDDMQIVFNKQDAPVIVKAKTSCKKCFGRGFIGINIKNQTMVICKCVEFIKKPTKKETPNENK